MSTLGTCPLCGNSAVLRRAGNWHICTCQACGEYAMDHDAAQLVPQELDIKLANLRQQVRSADRECLPGIVSLAPVGSPVLDLRYRPLSRSILGT